MSGTVGIFRRNHSLCTDPQTGDGIRPQRNRLHEALDVFEDYCHSYCLQSAAGGVFYHNICLCYASAGLQVPVLEFLRSYHTVCRIYGIFGACGGAAWKQYNPGVSDRAGVLVGLSDAGHTGERYILLLSDRERPDE